MTHARYGYGLWGLAIINSIVFILVAYTSSCRRYMDHSPAFIPHWSVDHHDTAAKV